MIRRLDEDGDLAPVGMISGTIEYRQLDVCVPHIGVLGAIQKLFFSKITGSVWEDHVEVARIEDGNFKSGVTIFGHLNYSAAGRNGDSVSISALTDKQSSIPVFQRVTINQSVGPFFVRCEPRARIVHRISEVSVVSRDGPAMAIFRKSGATKVDNRWIAGSIFIRTDLSESIQIELIAALTVLALS